MKAVDAVRRLICHAIGHAWDREFWEFGSHDYCLRCHREDLPESWMTIRRFRCSPDCIPF